LHRLILQHKAL